MRIRLKNSSEVAHVWASQSQSEGRCSNMFFDGADVTGQELDNYRVTSWDGMRLRVGCHDIGRDELVKIARVLGLPGALPGRAVRLPAWAGSR